MTSQQKQLLDQTKEINVSLIHDLRELWRENIREYGMFIALFIIMGGFAVATDGLFVSSRNLVNLVNQTGYIAVLAVGMTLVIVIRHIDLSVGYLSGFLGAIAAIAMVSWDLPVYVVIPFVLGLGILAGLLTSSMVAGLGIPAFVATLAGWLGYRGALQLATRATGTIIIPNAAFNAIGNGFIPDIPDIGILPGIHKVTLILGLLAIIVFIASEITSRIKMRKSNIHVLSNQIFVLKLVAVSALIGGIAWMIRRYAGS